MVEGLALLKPRPVELSTSKPPAASRVESPARARERGTGAIEIMKRMRQEGVGSRTILKKLASGGIYREGVMSRLQEASKLPARNMESDPRFTTAAEFRTRYPGDAAQYDRLGLYSDAAGNLDPSRDPIVIKARADVASGADPDAFNKLTENYREKSVLYRRKVSEIDLAMKKKAKGERTKNESPKEKSFKITDAKIAELRKTLADQTLTDEQMSKVLNKFLEPTEEVKKLTLKKKLIRALLALSGLAVMQAAKGAGEGAEI